MFYCCFPINNASDIKINVQQIICITSRHRNNPVLTRENPRIKSNKPRRDIHFQTT